jgi:hypothetical protein
MRLCVGKMNCREVDRDGDAGGDSLQLVYRKKTLESGGLDFIVISFIVLGWRHSLGSLSSQCMGIFDTRTQHRPQSSQCALSHSHNASFYSATHPLIPFHHALSHLPFCAHNPLTIDPITTPAPLLTTQPSNSALANMSTRALPPIAVLATHQPYTAPFLARLAIFILHAPLSTVKSALAPTSACASDSATCYPYYSIAFLCIDPNSTILRPSATVNSMSQRILRLLNAHFPRGQSPSPDTLPSSVSPVSLPVCVQ